MPAHHRLPTLQRCGSDHFIISSVSTSLPLTLSLVNQRSFTSLSYVDVDKPPQTTKHR